MKENMYIKLILRDKREVCNLALCILCRYSIELKHALCILVMWADQQLKQCHLICTLCRRILFILRKWIYGKKVGVRRSMLPEVVDRACWHVLEADRSMLLPQGPGHRFFACRLIEHFGNARDRLDVLHLLRQNLALVRPPEKLNIDN